MINVALVDDETVALKLFEMQLRKEIKAGDINLIGFDDPNKLLEYLEEDDNYLGVIILLSDINMPQMDGFTVLEIVKSKYPNIKVYMESAYDHSDYINKAYELGADGYLTKPINFEEVRGLIKENK